MQINERLSWYELTPVKQDKTGKAIKPTTGLIFVPGARVDPRAYAHVLRPLADAGYLVVVLKEPFGFSLPQPDHAETVLDVHPEIRYWAVGGHSLGGVNAASYADRDTRISGLLLYASYPACPQPHRYEGDVDLRRSDGLATPADIAAAKPKLPAAPNTW